MSKAQELLAAGEKAVVDCLMVPTSWLPEKYQGKSEMRKLSSVVKQAERKAPKRSKMQPREVSVEFHKVDGVRQIKWSKSTPERIAAIEDYRKQVENTGEINYLVDDVRQWGQMVDFCMKFGITSEEEDILSTMGPLKNN